MNIKSHLSALIGLDENALSFIVGMKVIDLNQLFEMTEDEALSNEYILELSYTSPQQFYENLITKNIEISDRDRINSIYEHTLSRLGYVYVPVARRQFQINAELIIIGTDMKSKWLPMNSDCLSYPEYHSVIKIRCGEIKFSEKMNRIHYILDDFRTLSSAYLDVIDNIKRLERNIITRETLPYIEEILNPPKSRRVFINHNPNYGWWSFAYQNQTHRIYVK